MSDQSRRKLLKSIAAGSGAIVAGKNLPESWSRPVVDSVMLPAHAETSPTRIYAAEQLQLEVVNNENNDNFMLAQWLKDGIDYLVPSASAQNPEGFRYNACAMVTGEYIDLWLQYTIEQDDIYLIAEGKASFMIGDTANFTINDYFLGGKGCSDPAKQTGTIEVIEKTDEYIVLGGNEGPPLKLLLAPSCPKKLVCVDIMDS